MKVGRNDHCPCGSGRKYKKCCLAADERAARKRGAPRPELPARDPAPASDAAPADRVPADPARDARDAFWVRFEAADYEERLRLFTEAMDTPGLLDSELAFEMLNLLAETACACDDHARLTGLFARLRDRCPAVYAAEEAFILDWWIPSALVLERHEEAAGLVRRFAETADREVDLFVRLLDQLAFQGRLPLLLEALRIAWPRVKESRGIMAWAVAEFADRAVIFEVLDVVETGMDAARRTAEIDRRAQIYAGNADPDLLDSLAGRLAGERTTAWSLDAFTPAAAQAGARNTGDLGWEFVAHLRRAGLMPATRAVLARDELVEYLVRRNGGALTETPSRSSDRRRPRKPPPGRSAKPHPLCPDRDSLERYAARLLNFINPQTCKLVALLAALPLWLGFLESRGLLDAQTRTVAAAGIDPLRAMVKQQEGQMASDPMLREAVAAL